MDAIQTALNATLPAFFLIALGAYADRLFPELHLPTLTRLTVYFMIPALVFNAVANTSLTLSSASLLSLGYLLYLAALGVVSALGSVGLNGAQTRGVIVTSLFGNTGNMGLPITLFAYGEAGLERAVVIFMISLVLMFVVGPTVLAGGGENLRTKLVDALKLPPIWATLAGLAFTLFAWELPTSAARGMSLLGDAAIPVMLLSLGLQMRRSWVWGVGASALRASGLRLVIGPFIAYTVGWLIGLRDLDLNVLTLSAAMPAAVTMFVVAVEVKGDYEGVARTVVATTVGSLAAIMVVLYFLPS